MKNSTWGVFRPQQCSLCCVESQEVTKLLPKTLRWWKKILTILILTNNNEDNEDIKDKKEKKDNEDKEDIKDKKRKER